MPKIARITLFQLSDTNIIPDAVQKYSTLVQDAKKDGKSYIISAVAGATHDDARNQGYNMVARTVFESREDVDYYDKECKAHAGIKAQLGPKMAGPPLVVFVDA